MSRRKPPKARKENQIRVRVTAQQKKTMAAAAERAGLELSTWLRTVGLRAAEQVSTQKP